MPFGSWPGESLIGRLSPSWCPIIAQLGCRLGVHISPEVLGSGRLCSLRARMQTDSKSGHKRPGDRATIARLAQSPSAPPQQRILEGWRSLESVDWGWAVLESLPSPLGPAPANAPPKWAALLAPEPGRRDTSSRGDSGSRASFFQTAPNPGHQPGQFQLLGK